MKSLTLSMRSPNYALVACVLGSVVASLIGCAADSSDRQTLPSRVEVGDGEPGSGRPEASSERAASDDTLAHPVSNSPIDGALTSTRFLGVSSAEAQAPNLTLAGQGTFWSPAASWKKRVTGADLDTNQRWQVAGTDLGIPYVLENGSIGFLFGDTFNTPFPEGPPPNDWRSPVMLRSSSKPGSPDGIVFDSAAKVRGNGRAPELIANAHDTRGLWNPRTEFTVIPNDGVSFPETGRQVISFMSVNHWRSAGLNGPQWRTGYASLAYSDNGNDFTRVPNLGWWNDEANTDPFQMWTMQRDGDWVYIFSVRGGRQDGPMMLQRVYWRNILDKSQYQGWGWNGSNWGWGRPCTPILQGRFGEPSVRRLANGTWAMAYLNAANGTIVTRTAAGPDRPWSAEKVQVAGWQEPSMYGGFIHPWSSTGENNLHIMVSKWTSDGAGHSSAYHVSQWVGTL